MPEVKPAGDKSAQLLVWVAVRYLLSAFFNHLGVNCGSERKACYNEDNKTKSSRLDE